MSLSEHRKSIQEFWEWFIAHRLDFVVLKKANDPFWDDALRQLQMIDSRLWFELSKPDGAEREFIFTAEGHVDVFPLADFIVAKAPKIHGWKFISLKPPMGFDFVTTYEGIQFNPHSMWFLPLEDHSRLQDLGLRVGIPQFSADIERETNNAVAVILDTALGERVSALDIQYIEVTTLPESPETEGYIELYELARYIEWRKRKISDI